MSVFKESPRDARSTTAAQIRARVSRAISMALAVALTAILLPAAISLAKTGHLRHITVIDVITGAATSAGTQDQPDAKGTQQDTPAAQVPAGASDDAEAALEQAGLPMLKDDRSVAARLSRGSNHGRDSASDSQGKGSSRETTADNSRHFADDPAPATTTLVDDNPSSDDNAAGDSGTQDDNSSSSENSSSDNSGSDNPGSGNAGADNSTADDHGNSGKRKDDGAKHATPKPASPAPAGSPEPATETPAETAPATDAATATAPAIDASTDPAAITADTRRRFDLDPTESASLIVNVSPGADHITLWARAAGADCAPRIAVTVDGEPTSDRDITLTGPDWQSHTITPVPDAGEHVIRVASLGTDPQAGCADATQDVVTIVEPKLDAEGDAAPVDDTTATTTDTTAAAGTSAADDGTADQGTGDAAGTTGSGTTGSGTTGSGTTGADDGTADQGTGDAAGTTTDSRRQYSLYTRESVSLAAEDTGDGTPLTMWLRSSSADCQARVIVFVDDRVQKVIGVDSTDWQSENIDFQTTGTRHRIVIGVLRPKGTCSGAETLSIIEPKAGEEGAATPLAPVDTTTDTTGNTLTDGTTPATDGSNGGGSNGGSSSGSVVSGSGRAPGAVTSATDSSSSSAAGAATSATDSSSSSAAGTVLETSSFESGDLSQWGQQYPAGAPMTIVSSPVSEGRYATKFTLAPGQLWNGTSRSELVGIDQAGTLSNGQVRYFAWSVYLPADLQWSSDWRVLAQWKNGGTGSPPLELKLQDQQWQLDGGFNGGDNADTSDLRTAWSGAAEKGRWTKFVIGIKFQERSASNPYAGWLELWKDGVQVLNRTPWKTLYLGRTSYLKAGLYRSTSISTTDTVYQDGWKMGTTYASVAG